jgi:hypothetical protein
MVSGWWSLPVRKWLLWGIEIVAVAAVVLVGLTVALGRTAEFEFLEGWQKVRLSAAYEQRWGRVFGKWDIYVKNTDFAQVKAEAKRELASLGYEEDQDNESDMYEAFVKAEPPPASTRADQGVDVVDMWRDTRAVSDGSFSDAKGWVTVRVHGKREQEGFFDRIRAWFGL